MDWIDHKYITLCAGNLIGFQRKNDHYNFRCPFCGDSKKSKTKARGYIFEREGKPFFKCHNCSVATNLFNLFVQISADLADQYRTEKFKESIAHSEIKLVEKKPDITSSAKPLFIKYSPLKSLQKISQLKPDHPAKKYIVKRQIPPNFHYKLFFCPKFKRWVNTFIPDKFDLSQPDEPRLIIPLLDSYGNFIGLQGRSFSKTGLRYITIIVDETKPKVYGLDHTDVSKYTYLFEGPIDSMFIPNSLAMSGADCLSALKKMEINKDNLVFVYDNEPRNKQICDRIARMIELGYKVCLWPAHIKQKDVNDMVLAGIKPADIKLIIDNNTFRGLEAKLHFSTWRKS